MLLYFSMILVSNHVIELINDEYFDLNDNVSLYPEEFNSKNYIIIGNDFNNETIRINTVLEFIEQKLLLIDTIVHHVDTIFLHYQKYKNGAPITVNEKEIFLDKNTLDIIINSEKYVKKSLNLKGNKRFKYHIKTIERFIIVEDEKIFLNNILQCYTKYSYFPELNNEMMKIILRNEELIDITIKKKNI